MLAVFVERRRADAVQFSAGERRFEQVGRVHRPFGGAGADQGMHLVDEQNDLTGCGGHFTEYGLQPLLEFATKLGASDKGAEAEGHQLFMFQVLGHVAIDDALCQALDDCGLADSRFADQDRIVLGPPRQHLDGSTNLLVAADDRVDLALGCRLGQIAGVLL